MQRLIGAADARYAYDIVDTICREVGPGLPGSSQEGERAAIIKRELASHLGAENVVQEEFTVAPWALVSAYPVSAVFMLLGALLNLVTGRLAGVSSWVTALAALACSILSPLVFMVQFVFNRGLLDAMLPKKGSVNVVGRLRRPGARDVKRLLILSGHHDSAPANTWFGLLHGFGRLLLGTGPVDPAREQALFRRLGYVFYVLSTVYMLGFVVMLALAVIQLAGLIAGSAGLVRFGTLGWVLLVCPIVPSIVYALFFTRQGKNGGMVPGAADNLSAGALAVAVCRFLVRNPSYVPPDTEIRFISFGSEEAGLRGSRCYVERHRDELVRMDARVLNFETIAGGELRILSAEGSGTVKVSPVMVPSVVAAANRAGVPYKVERPSLGVASDAAPFCQAGLKAATVMAFKMPEQMIAFYHQKWDRPEVLDQDTLLNAFKLALEWTRCGGE